MKINKYGCSINIFGDGINFYTDCYNAYSQIIGLKHFFYVDYFKVDIIDNTLKYSLSFEDDDEEAGHIEKISPTFFQYIDSWDEICNTTQLRSVIYQIIELARQEKSRFLIHGSAVSTEEGSLVFLGDGGSGKSSTMLRMCQEHNAKMISNDKVVVGLEENTFIVEKGSRYINLRESSVRIFNSDLETVFDSVDSKTKAGTWNNKRKFFPNELKIDFEEEITKLKAIVMIDINESWEGEPIFYSLPDPEKKDSWLDTALFSKYFTGLIRGVEQVSFNRGNILHESFLMPLLDNNLTLKNRVRFINKVVEEKKVYILKARFKQGIDLIVNEIMCKK